MRYPQLADTLGIPIEAGL